MPHLKVQAENAGERLDVWLVQKFPDYSRAFLQKWVKAGRVRVQGKAPTPSDHLRAGDIVDVVDFNAAESAAPASAIKREEPARPIDGPEPQIIFEDAALLVLNKPAGLVVHPAFSYRGSTLIDWLRRHLGGKVTKLFTDPERLGLVHRLDKDTSGVLVIAKSVPAQVSLSKQFHDRKVRKTYMAWVQGVPASTTGVITAPVGRSRKDPTRMAVTGSGRASETAFEVKESLKEVSLLIVRPKTGRTHQIRVHTAAMGHPIVGDVTYGADPLWAKRHGVERPLLHAQQLEIVHPSTGKPVTFDAKPPADFRSARAAFRKLAVAFIFVSLVSSRALHAAESDGSDSAAPTPPPVPTAASTPKPHHKASASSSGVSSSAFRQMRKDLGGMKDQLDALQAEFSTLKDELAGIEAGLTQLDAARRIRDLERALPDMNAKLTTASNNAEEARSQAADTTRKMRALQDSADGFRDQLDKLQRQIIQQRAKQEDAQVQSPPPADASDTGKKQ